MSSDELDSTVAAPPDVAIQTAEPLRSRIQLEGWHSNMWTNNLLQLSMRFPADAAEFIEARAAEDACSRIDIVIDVVRAVMRPQQ